MAESHVHYMVQDVSQNRQKLNRYQLHDYEFIRAWRDITEKQQLLQHKKYKKIVSLIGQI